MPLQQMLLTPFARRKNGAVPPAFARLGERTRENIIPYLVILSIPNYKILCFSDFSVVNVNVSKINQKQLKFVKIAP